MDTDGLAMQGARASAYCSHGIDLVLLEYLASAPELNKLNYVK